MNKFEAPANGPVVLLAISGPHPGFYVGAGPDGWVWVSSPAAAVQFPTAAEASAYWRGDPDLYRFAVSPIPLKEVTGR